MPDLAQIHLGLVEDYRESFEIAADKLLAKSSWLLEATPALITI